MTAAKIPQLRYCASNWNFSMVSQCYFCSMSDNQHNRTELSEVGEFGLIDRLTAGLQPIHSETIKGVGDDAAVVNRNEWQCYLISTDLLAEGVHFDLAYCPLKHLGYKAVAVNLSDICAMNGVPSHIVVSLAISNRFSLEAVEELYAGIKAACSMHHIDIIGGDTTSSHSGLVISITAFGLAEKSAVTYRSGARENDLIVVSGDLGAAYIGLQLLEREKAVFKSNPGIQPDLSGNDYILQRQLKPAPRTDIVRKLKEAGIQPTSMIDVSDGLASELIHLSRNSGLGMRVYEEKIPIDPATVLASEEFNLHPLTCALNGGEDYELLFTVAQGDFEKLTTLRELSVIGHVTGKDEGADLITADGRLIELTSQGWVHFGRNEGE
jgi:thiamine-monophosphate kinase